MSEVIRVTCANGHALKVKAKAAGTTLRCPQEGCGAEVAVPEVFPEVRASEAPRSLVAIDQEVAITTRHREPARVLDFSGRPLDPPTSEITKEVFAGIGLSILVLVMMMIVGGLMLVVMVAFAGKLMPAGLFAGWLGIMLIAVSIAFVFILIVWPVCCAIEGYRQAFRAHAFPKGMDDASAIPWLVGLTGHRHAFLRVAACARLEKLGPSAASAAPGLIQVSSWPHEGTRAAAAAALGAIGPAAASALPRLRLMLNEPGGKARASALAALASIDPRSPETRAALEGAVDDRNADLQLAAIAALLDGGCDPTHLAPRVVRHLGTPRPDRLLRAVTAAGRCGAASKPAIPQLRRLFKHPDKRVRLAAREAVSKIDNDFAAGKT